MNTLKRQYSKVAKLQRELRAEAAYLDTLIQQRWGFNFSETDDDRIIDTLDYGTDGLSFDGFVEKMNEYKAKYDETGKYK
jgi:hypothetical protein